MKQIQKLYARAVGVFFVLVAISLIADFAEFGHRPETWHKAFHVLLGAIVLYYGWNSEKFWKPFCLANGAIFLFAGAFGFAFPDFGNLDAFNRVDTILHTIVGASGLAVGILGKTKG